MGSNFPLRAPIGLLTGGLLAVISIIPILAAWQALRPPVQRFYLGQYVVTYISGTPIGTVAQFFKGSKVHTYHVLAQHGRPVEELMNPAAGAILIHTVRMESPAAFHSWLKAHIYNGLDTPDLFRTPMGIWCFVALFVFALGAVLDFRRRKRSREGEQLRGGELLTVNEFNRVTKGDGFALYVRK